MSFKALMGEAPMLSTYTIEACREWRADRSNEARSSCSIHADIEPVPTVSLK